MVRVPIIVLVEDGMYEDSLVVDREDGVCWDVDPVFCQYVSGDIAAKLRSVCLPRSNVRGSLATKTTSAPMSLRAIW